ncbi:hypothetical protein M885DRAFT_548871 [Pelagophyceae sp. CCMP2097]|nr:hypothetical protein M885DRAFT_548871 [Pelagophyceae sp. CCMP2097]
MAKVGYALVCASAWLRAAADLGARRRRPATLRPKRAGALGGVASLRRYRGGFSDPYDDGFSSYGESDPWNAEQYVGGGSEYENYDRPRPRAGEGGLAALERILPDRKTGMIMCVLGAASTMLGVSLFFEKNLIRIGNVLLLSGAPIVVGPQRAARYLMAPAKLRGSLVFLMGFMLVLSGHPLLGIVVEVFGFCNLFGNLFPLVGTMLKRLPLMSQLAGVTQPGGGNTGFGGGNSGFDY